jgi:hypothetical protein
VKLQLKLLQKIIISAKNSTAAKPKSINTSLTQTKSMPTNQTRCNGKHREKSIHTIQEKMKILLKF